MRLSDLTIIVPTRNEMTNLPVLLRSIPAGLPVVVVDASDDDTPNLALRLRPQATRVIRHPGNIAQARQIGAEAADTDWLIFTDADVHFAADFFLTLTNFPARQALYGPKLSRSGFEAYYRQVADGQRLAHRLGIPAVSGSNLAVHRAALRAVGGFDLDLSCTEDSELGWRLRRRGQGIDFVPGLVVWAHDHRRLRKGVGRKTLHTLARSALLYFNLLPARWRRHDWGYWDTPRSTLPR